ncbi:MAG: hypothetical protein V1859_01730 [archaeon]
MVIADIFRATRIERACFGLAAAFVPISRFPISTFYAISFEFTLFCVAATLLYCALGIMNAWLDNDFSLPLLWKKVVFIMFIATIIVSLFSIKVFFAVLAYIFLGIIYNTVARKIFMMDGILLSIAHYFLPVFFTSYLLNADIVNSLYLSFYFFAFSFFFMPLKNIRGAKEDRKRGYKTIPAMHVAGGIITLMLMDISFFVMLIGFFAFRLSLIYLVCLFLMLVLGSILKFLHSSGNEELFGHVFRLGLIFFPLSFILSSSPPLYVVLFPFALFIVLIYKIYSFIKKSGMLTYKCFIFNLNNFIIWHKRVFFSSFARTNDEKSYGLLTISR